MNPVAIQIADKLPILCSVGMQLKTVRKTFDQRDIHYFEKNPKFIESDEIVNVIEVFSNFYGRYIRCDYNGDIYDIKPTDLSYDNLKSE